jgi:hypothetical protein
MNNSFFFFFFVCQIKHSFSVFQFLKDEEKDVKKSKQLKALVRYLEFFQ